MTLGGMTPSPQLPLPSTSAASLQRHPLECGQEAGSKNRKWNTYGVACCLSDKSRVTNKNRNEKAEQGRVMPSFAKMSGGIVWSGKNTEKKEKTKERDNILQEKASPCRELADEYLLESTKD